MHSQSQNGNKKPIHNITMEKDLNNSISLNFLELCKPRSPHQDQNRGSNWHKLLSTNTQRMTILLG